MNKKIEMYKGKIYCHTCDGWGYITEMSYPDSKIVCVSCYECNGKGWVEV